MLLLNKIKEFDLITYLVKTKTNFHTEIAKLVLFKIFIKFNSDF
jgi:hypothetical protein